MGALAVQREMAAVLLVLLLRALAAALEASGHGGRLELHLVGPTLEQAQAWLWRLPGWTVNVYAEAALNTSHLVALGYSVRTFGFGDLPECSHWLAQAPVDRRAVGLCLLHRRGGLLVDPERAADVRPMTLQHTDTVLVKRRVAGLEHCPWCLNGFYAADPAMVYAKGPQNRLVAEALRLLKGHEQSAEVCLTMAVKGTARSYSQLIDEPPALTAASSVSGDVVHAPYIAITRTPEFIGDAIRLSALGSVSATVEVTAGTIRCGSGDPSRRIELPAGSQAEANRLLAACEYYPDPAGTAASLTVAANGRLSTIPLYNLGALVTIVVKTIGRMPKVLELVETAQRLYPAVPVLVGDDGKGARDTAEGPKRGFFYLPFAYDIGLSEGRNRLVGRVKTPYALFLDDDFRLTEQSNLGLLVHELAQGRHDLVAGKSPNCDTDYSGILRVLSRGRLVLLPTRRPVAGSQCLRVDMVPNLFLAKVALFDRLKWDPALKLGEHEDFFLRARRLGVRVATCPAVTFDHRQTPRAAQTPEYRRLRERVWGFLAQALQKHGLRELVVFGRRLLVVEPVALTDIAQMGQIEAMPFAAKVRLVAAVPRLVYRAEIRNAKGKLVGALRIRNPDRKRELVLPFTRLEPGSAYTLSLRPGNHTHWSEQALTLSMRTTAFRTDSTPARGPPCNPPVDVLWNSKFDRSTWFWRHSLGSVASVIPLFFPRHDTRYTERRLSGQLHEHIEGRPSNWACRDKGRRMGRNFAAVVSVPATTSDRLGGRSYELFQEVPVPEYCREVECRVYASCWVRVDKIWGAARFALEVALPDGAVHEALLDPRETGRWQYAELTALPVGNAGRIKIGVRLAAHRGAYFADDFYLAFRPQGRHPDGS